MARLTLQERADLRELWQRLGGLSRPSKMPGYGWSIPAELCRAGGQLQKVEGSVCNVCYATRNHYQMSRVQQAMRRRYAAWQANPAAWLGDMVMLLLLSAKQTPKRMEHFRWFDSGDLQNETMLENIMDIAWCLPETKFWLPTREYSMVSKVLETQVVPPNLCIRLSAHMIGSVLALNPDKFDDGSNQVTTSAVGVNGGHRCPALNQGNKCGACRACWSPDVALVTYTQH